MPAECKYQPVSLHPPLPEDLYDNCLYEDMAVNNSKRVTRKWEMFAGRNRFYCDGRLMTAPNSGVFLLTVCLITGTSTLFFVFDCQYLAENVTFAIPVVGGILYVFTMSALLRTSLSDPGIIPRATPDEAAYVEKQIEVTNSANSPTYRPPPRTKEVLVKGQTVKLKYCFTCKIFRPPRASHCSLCDNCVDRFDHHCPWVGNCVGRRNYRFFYMFIVSLAFLSVFIFACAIAHLILITKEDKQFLDAMKDSPASVLVAAVCFFSVWSILGLAGFHTYLTTSNQTTNEDIKGSFTSKRGQEGFNPYSQANICLNCFHILCGPLTPSLIDRRGVVTDEYRLEVTHPVIIAEPSISLKGYPLQQNGQTQLGSCEMPSLYRQTTENLDSNAGSVTHLVTSEAPLSVVPAVPEPLPQPDLTHSHVYNNVVSIQTPVASPSVAYSHTVVNEKIDKVIGKIEDLHLDPVVLLPGGEPKRQPEDSIKLTSVHGDNDNNGLLSASRLRMLQDTTMIESALDLDSIDETSLGAGGQVGLMKVTV